MSGVVVTVDGRKVVEVDNAAGGVTVAVTGQDPARPADVRGGEKNDLEALKLLSDWCKWSIVAQAGVIAAIGTFVKPEDIVRLNVLSRCLLAATVFLFVVSILAASVILKSLPATAQRLPPDPGKDIFHMGTFEGTKPPRLYHVTTVQTVGFVLGIVALAAFVVLRIAWPQPVA